MEGLLAVLIPAVFGVVGVIVGAVLMRRTSKESNETTAFTAVTDQLFELNKGLREDVEALKGKVTSLETDLSQSKQENSELRNTVRQVTGELEILRQVNGALARTVKKLVEAWPTGFTLPELDFDWRKHLP